MARTVARLPAGSRITDHISLGVIAKTFPLSKVHSVLVATGTASVRQRNLPSHVMVYYVIAMALYMHSSCREVLRCLLEGVQWLLDPSATIKVTGKSGISQARTRLGWEPVRRLHDELVKPIAVRSTRGAWYRHWRLVSLDGSTLDIADDPDNGALRHSRTDARSRPPSRQGPRRTFFPPYGPRRPSQAPALRGNSPLGRGVYFMRPCSTKSWTNWSPPVAADAIRAASNAR